jgi:hypothetical protein
MDNIDFKSGDVIYNEFKIDFNKKYSEQEDCLLEDLLQVTYAQGYLLDVGWYPELESEGEFVVQIVKEKNWEEPIYKSNSKNKEDLVQDLNNAIRIIESKI